MQKPRIIETTAHNNPVTLSPTLTLDVNDLIGQQLAVFGMPGYGKTNAVALMCEQISPYLIPMAIFDKEGDFTSLLEVLPRGVLATPQNCPSGRDILTRGLQVVYDLSQWEDDHTRANVIVSVTNQLMQFASGKPSHERVPCLIVVDEAHHWLPESRGAHLEKEEFVTLFSTFQSVGSTGRKRGLTPFYACPKISELNKGILYPGMYVFFRATLHTDVKRYLEYIHSTKYTPRGLQDVISSLPRGKAIVKLPNGGQKTVAFHKRVSEHTSHTPTAQAAMNAYASMPFNRSETYGNFEAPDVDAPTPIKKLVAKKPVKRTVKRAKKRITKTTTPHRPAGQSLAKERMTTILAETPDMPMYELARKSKCSVQQAKIYKAEIEGTHE